MVESPHNLLNAKSLNWFNNTGVLSTLSREGTDMIYQWANCWLQTFTSGLQARRLYVYNYNLPHSPDTE